jgi:hypothetical protein
MLQRALPTGFIAPCLPPKTYKLPSGGQRLPEIKHDGFRIIARKDSDRVRLYSRPSNDFTRRFPLIVGALTRLRSRSCMVDFSLKCAHRSLALQCSFTLSASIPGSFTLRLTSRRLSSLPAQLS